MLVLDTQGQQAFAAGEKRESEQERRMRLLAHDIDSNSVTVGQDNGTDVTNLIAQIGRPMTSQQVIGKLKKCNERLHFVPAPAFPDKIGIYLLRPGFMHGGSLETNYIHICGMSHPILPEFSVRHSIKVKKPSKDIFSSSKSGGTPDWVEVPTIVDETRGWRTVLVRLLHAGLINRLDVETHFGWTPSRDSENWYKQTK